MDKRKKRIIVISVLVVIVALAVIWFEIPRIKIRNYINENLPEGSYSLSCNYGDFATVNSYGRQSSDRIWRAYDKDRNLYFNIVQTNRETDIDTKDSAGSDEYYLHDDYALNFMARNEAFLIYDDDKKYHTNLSIEYVPSDEPENHEIYYMAALGGEFTDRKGLDTLFDDLYVATRYFEEKNVPSSFGRFQFRYINEKYYDELDHLSFLMYGRLNNVETARTEAYRKMIEIGLKHDDESILSQFTNEEIDSVR